MTALASKVYSTDKGRSDVGPTLGFKAKARSQKYKKARYSIRNVSEKDLSKTIKDFEKIDKLPYEKKRPKHEPTDSYFQPARQIAKCKMRSDNLNCQDHGGFMEMNAPSQTLMLRTRTNQKKSSCTEIYRRINLRT